MGINIELTEEELNQIEEATKIVVSEESLQELRKIKIERTIVMSKVIRNKESLKELQEVTAAFNQESEEDNVFDNIEKTERLTSFVLGDTEERVSELLQNDFQEILDFVSGLIPKG